MYAVQNARQARRDTRRVIEKTRDLTFGKKVSRLYPIEAGGRSAIVVCLEKLREYVDCLFETIEAEDVRLEQLKHEALAGIDSLIQEVNSGAQQLNTVSRGVIGNTLRRHTKLFNFALANSITLRPCSQEWSDTMNLAVRVWGNNI